MFYECSIHSEQRRQGYERALKAKEQQANKSEDVK